MNEYYANEMERKINDKDCSLKNNIGQNPNFTQIKAEIHSIPTNLNDQPSTSTSVYHFIVINYFKSKEIYEILILSHAIEKNYICLF